MKKRARVFACFGLAQNTIHLFRGLLNKTLEISIKLKGTEKKYQIKS